MRRWILSSVRTCCAERTTPFPSNTTTWVSYPSGPVAYSQISAPEENRTSVGRPDWDRTSDIVETPGANPPYDTQPAAARVHATTPARKILRLSPIQITIRQATL